MSPLATAFFHSADPSSEPRPHFRDEGGARRGLGGESTVARQPLVAGLGFLHAQDAAVPDELDHLLLLPLATFERRHVGFLQ
jgi:hypothetical protein